MCDTGVLIECLRHNPQVVAELEQLGFENLAISCVTVAEISYGMKKNEARVTRELINQFNKFHLTKEISVKFLQLMLGYQTQKIRIPDALIAATGIVENALLFTFNQKDFDYIEGIEFYKPTRTLKS
jgi:tRNA(fMet)-specific endonuclease VapC